MDIQERLREKYKKMKEKERRIRSKSLGPYQSLILRAIHEPYTSYWKGSQVDFGWGEKEDDYTIIVDPPESPAISPIHGSLMRALMVPNLPIYEAKWVFMVSAEEESKLFLNVPESEEIEEYEMLLDKGAGVEDLLNMILDEMDS